MRAASSEPRRPGRAGASLLAFVALLAAVGCGNAAREAEIYRVQRGYWLAYREAQEITMRGGRPDSTVLLAVRKKFIEAVDQAAPTIKAMVPGRPRSELDARLLKVVGYGEIQAARLAIDAGRSDLALERCRALVVYAEGDTAVTRQADIMIYGALRHLGRYDEAAESMRSMQVRYAPRPPDSTGTEDFLLSIPTVLTTMRRDLGDEAGARRELELGQKYYQGLLAKENLDPGLEAQIRLHLAHTYLELGRKSDALAALDAAELAVMSHPTLAAHIPEIRYTRVRLTGLEAKDPTVPAATLERIAFDFPQSPVAPLALFDAAYLLEKAREYDRANQGYASVLARYPRQSETAANALYRQAALEERSGQWDRAKTILESIPTKYPYTAAGAQAPLAMAEHYQRAGDPSGLRVSLRRAVEIYQRMIAADSIASTTPRLRWNLVRTYANLDDTRGVFRTVDGMSDKNPAEPLTGRALIVAANFAESKKLRNESARYLNKYLQSFPDSPAAPQVRAKLRELGKA